MSTTRKVLRLARVNGNGTEMPETVTLVLKNPVTGDPILNDDGTPAVFVTLKPMTEEQRKAIVGSHTTTEKDPNGGRGLFEKTDADAANDEILDRSIVSWEGIAGADDRPLVCTPGTKRLLDGYIKAQITKKLFGSEVVEVLAASFR
jgi:hypothetical protein